MLGLSPVAGTEEHRMREAGVVGSGMGTGMGGTHTGTGMGGMHSKSPPHCGSFHREVARVAFKPTCHWQFEPMMAQRSCTLLPHIAL